MGVQKAMSDCFIFGNPSGLEDLADVIEESAFQSSYDSFSSAPAQPGYFRHLRGYVSTNFAAPEGIYLSCGWGLLGGSFYNPVYNEEAKRFYQPDFKERPEEKDRQFINERICHEHTI